MNKINKLKLWWQKWKEDFKKGYAEGKTNSFNFWQDFKDKYNKGLKSIFKKKNKKEK
jgi:hypothetical protein